MATIAALIPTQNQTDQAIQQLADLHIEGLNWELLNGPADLEPGHAGMEPDPDRNEPHAEVRMVVAGDDTADLLVHKGVPKHAAGWFARRLGGQATVLVVSTPAAQEETVRRILEQAGGRTADRP